jgi:hypothetical protein
MRLLASPAAADMQACSCPPAHFTACLVVRVCLPVRHAVHHPQGEQQVVHQAVVALALAQGLGVLKQARLEVLQGGQPQVGGWEAMMGRR